jgi:hypothetical protein
MILITLEGYASCPGEGEAKTIVKVAAASRRAIIVAPIALQVSFGDIQGI